MTSPATPTSSRCTSATSAKARPRRRPHRPRRRLPDDGSAMKFSVRSRLTLSVAVLAGVVALGAALVAPRLIEDALIDDSLAAEAASSRTVLDSGLFGGFPADEIGTLHLNDNDLGVLLPDLSGTDALAESRPVARR